MTSEAAEILGAARQLQQTIVHFERCAAGEELRLEREIRVTTTDALLTSTVTPHLASFGKLHPHITIELTLTNHRLSLTRRDADVAIRPTPKPPENLVGRTLLDIEFGLYASPGLRRLGGSLRGVETGLWMLTHPDLLRSVRIYELVEHFSNALAAPSRA